MNYFSKLLLPMHLSCFYPYPETLDVINSNWVYVSPVFVLLLCALIWWAFKKSKVVVFGIFFFLITIFLVLQLIPVGDAIIADRYTYLPAIGLFFIFAFYFDKYYSNNKILKIPLLSIGLVITISLSAASFNRAKLWKDTISIYTDCLKNYDVPIIYNNRAAAYYNMQNYPQSIKDISACLALKPKYPHAAKNLGMTYEKLKDYDSAYKYFSKEIEQFPNDFNNFINRARALKSQNHLDSAFADYSQAIALDSTAIDAYFGRGEILAMRGKIQESVNDLSKIIAISPDHPEVLSNRGTMYSQLNKPDLALQDLDKAIKLKPDEGSFYRNRMLARFAIKNFSGALEDAFAARQKGIPIDDATINQIKASIGEGKQ